MQNLEKLCNKWYHLECMHFTKIKHWWANITILADYLDVALTSLLMTCFLTSFSNNDSKNPKLFYKAFNAREKTSSFISVVLTPYIIPYKIFSDS